MYSDCEKIAHRIKAKRNELELSTKAVARFCKVDVKLVEEWEQGINLPESEKLYLLSKTLYTHPFHLIYGEKDREMEGMGKYLIILLVILSVTASFLTLFYRLSFPGSSFFVAAFQGAIVFSIFYWFASMLKTNIEIKKNTSYLLYEIIKKNE